MTVENEKEVVEEHQEVTISIPAYIHTISDDDRVRLDDLMRAFGNTRRRAYILKQKGKNRRQIELALLDTALNGRYVRDAHLTIKDLPPHVTFGGKKNQRLREQKKISREEYKRRRNSILYSRGEASKKGNLNIRLVPDEEWEKNDMAPGSPGMGLRIRDTLNDVYIHAGLYIPGKYWQRYGHLLDGASAYSVLIKRRGERYFVHIQVEIHVPKRPSERVMTLDINAGHIDYAVMEREDEGLVSVGRIDLHETMYTKKGKRDDQCWKTANKIANMAGHYGADVVMGDLKTGSYRGRANRKIRGMPQHKLRENITQKVKEKGLDARSRSEAYTSKVGEILSKRIGLDIHKSSAICFGLKVISYDKFLHLRKSHVDEGGGSLSMARTGEGGLTAPHQGLSRALVCDNGYPTIPGSWGLDTFVSDLKKVLPHRLLRYVKIS